MDTYTCLICGYIYDTEDGDPTGCSFEELPDDWSCPVCGAPKSEFEKE